MEEDVEAAAATGNTRGSGGVVDDDGSDAAKATVYLPFWFHESSEKQVTLSRSSSEAKFQAWAAVTGCGYLGYCQLVTGMRVMIRLKYNSIDFRVVKDVKVK
nr:hypothetical protein Iba_chr12aCG13720 [Ipomoea batatas]